MSRTFLYTFAVALVTLLIMAPGGVWAQHQTIGQVNQFGQPVGPYPQHQPQVAVPQTGFPLPTLCPQGNCGGFPIGAVFFPPSAGQPLTKTRSFLLEFRRTRMFEGGRTRW